ncbi:probable long-chain-alcohol O-fatty-acyltransferase 5 [Rutidosis leptorrhynchoides]|uniref:probable long-chain-alcohol O-fatty-acyltransferase 5 n=1 Tax=Rutidosis leptorrhynchoides TaxID=125765 RepID=UPI003A98FA35
MDLKEEMKNLIKVSVSVSIGLSYCYFLGKFIPKGFPRLLMILPVVVSFISFPIFFNSVHLIGAFSFFISWLANFKLILFAFGNGPLSSPSIPLSRFLSFACFPIAPATNPQKKTSSSSLVFSYCVKALLFAIFLKVYYDHGAHMNPMMAWSLFASCIYLSLDVILGTISLIIGFLLGIEFDPQFDEPYLSTSLHNFWGRRWNIMVNRVVHPTIYTPVLTLSSRVIPRVWAPILAILATFMVSGLMHELIFWYFTRDWPTWDTMLFFCIHGLSLVTEILIKKFLVNFKWTRTYLARGQHVSTPFVVLYVLATSYWWFYPDLLRCKIIERAFQEYKAIGNIFM